MQIAHARIAANSSVCASGSARAAERAGRRSDDVPLIGVSKVRRMSRIRGRLAAGIGRCEKLVRKPRQIAGARQAPVPGT